MRKPTSFVTGGLLSAARWDNAPNRGFICATHRMRAHQRYHQERSNVFFGNAGRRARGQRGASQQ